jgi:Tryptophan-associated transmembrane protein (Trp_oprn_chp)
MAKRPLWIIVVLLLGTAAALWGATKVSWVPAVASEPAHQPGLGTGAPGAVAPSSLTELALLALASLVGMFAVGGWVRRALGGIIVVAGGFVCWRASAEPGPWELFTGRGVALLGGLLFVAAGLLIIRFATELPTMGVRYELANTERRSGDPDKDMWDDLSHGDDPTRN